MAGPAIGALALLGGIHVPFLVVAAIAGANALVALRRLPETNPRPAAAPVDRPDRPSGWRRLGLGGGDARAVALYVGVTFVAVVAFSAFEATFALFVERRLGLRLVSIYLAFVGVGVLITLVQVGLVHPCVRRWGEMATVRLGLVLNAVGLLVLGAAQSWPALIPALACLTVGQGLVTPALASLVAGAAGAGQRGGTLGFQQAAGGLARVVGPVAGGFLLQFAGLSAPYVAGAVVLVGAALFLVARPQPVTGEVPAAPSPSAPAG